MKFGAAWLLLLSLGIGASHQVSGPGALGTMRFTLDDAHHEALPKGSRLLDVTGSRYRIESPVTRLSDLDLFASLSHEATGMCGSIEYFPLNYQRIATVDHYPPVYDAELRLSPIEDLIGRVELDRIEASVQQLSSLPSRYHAHSTGRDAGQNVQNLWQDQLAAGSPWELRQVTHAATAQRSVIARLPGDSDETIVLGAHLDSITSRSNPELAAPGADDDASGVAILAEILRILSERGLRFHRTIELQAYAAEEIGLIGSREIAQKARADAQKIAGMLQFDMAFYSQASDVGKIWFLEDFTSLDLTRSAVHWLKNYVGEVYLRGAMPRGAASDHKSWFDQGYPTLFPFENPVADNPHIHTTGDTMDKFDDGLRAQRMTQLGLIFLVYQAGLKGLTAEQNSERARLAALDTPSDIFVALQGTGPYSFAVSAPAGTAYLEFCQIESAADLRCQKMRQRLTNQETIEGRSVYVSGDDLSFAAGESWRIEAFDAGDELLARRSFSWSAD